MDRVALVFTAVLLCAPPLPAMAGGKRSGKIEEARERMRENTSSSSEPARERSRSSSDHSNDYTYSDYGEPAATCWDCGGGDSGSVVAGWIFYSLLAGPFLAPALIVGDWYPLRHFGFRAYPYESGHTGTYRFHALDELGEPTEPKPFALSLRVLTAYERHGPNLDGRRLDLSLRSNTRFNLDASLTRYTEAFGPGDVDQLWHSKALLTYSFAVSPRASFTVGAGVRNMRFSAGDDFTHVAFRYGFELFPVQPLHAWVLGEAGGGASGASTEVEIGVGVLMNRFELFAGYRRFSVVGVDFAGPEIGLLAWL